jgi:hypothetical protein
MKSKQAQGRVRKPPPASKSNMRKFDATVHEGMAITFGPTGEKLRIAKIANGTITFEKLP